MLAIPEESTDTRMLSTSPVLLRDVLYSNFNNLISTTPYLEDDIAAEVECGNSFGDRDYFYNESVSATTSCATSIASSDFSDDGYIDIEDDTLSPFLEGMECNLNFSNSAMQGINKKVMEWNSGLKHCAKSNTVNPCGSVFGNKQRLQNEINLKLSDDEALCACRNIRKKIVELAWSEMSAEDQVDTVEYLTRVVSITMGLREQLEIIRIINPSARVLPTDTEFVIDLDTFDNYKFQRIRQFVSQHLPQDKCPLCSDISGSLSSCSSSTSSSHGKCSKRRNVKPLSTKRISRKATKHKGVLARVHKQMLKERRSGLFQHEEVISLNSCDHSPDDTQDAEIDILS